jgi:hypothetical protein
MKPVIQVCTLLISVCCTLAFAQPTPQQIQQHQMGEQRALQQREQEQRDQQQRDSQMEKMRQIDRQQAEDAHQLEEKARAKAIATQENLYLLQQAEQQKAQAQTKSQAADQNVPTAIQQVQTVPSTPQTEAPPAQAAAASRWSFSNMTTLDKAGLAALGVLLIALACAAGIIPAKRISSSRNPR